MVKGEFTVFLYDGTLGVECEDLLHLLVHCHIPIGEIKLTSNALENAFIRMAKKSSAPRLKKLPVSEPRL